MLPSLKMKELRNALELIASYTYKAGRQLNVAVLRLAAGDAQAEASTSAVQPPSCSANGLLWQLMRVSDRTHSMANMNATKGSETHPNTFPSLTPQGDR